MTSVERGEERWKLTIASAPTEKSEQFTDGVSFLVTNFAGIVRLAD